MVVMKLKTIIKEWLGFKPCPHIGRPHNRISAEDMAEGLSEAVMRECDCGEPFGDIHYFRNDECSPFYLTARSYEWKSPPTFDLKACFHEWAPLLYRKNSTPVFLGIYYCWNCKALCKHINKPVFIGYTRQPQFEYPGYYELVNKAEFLENGNYLKALRIPGVPVENLIIRRDVNKGIYYINIVDHV